MKPAQIRVFDGLRITTDHVNHLQGALASGFEDLRQILGLGHAQTGLDVAVADDGTVTIQPGVAFDFEKNRLACDDPLNLKVSFAQLDQAKYICLKYEQVEDGAVEGHPTMIWDSCSGLVRDVLPDPKENLVTLVRVVKTADGKLQVRPPVDPPENIQPEFAPFVEVPVGPASPGQNDGSSPPAAANQPGTVSPGPDVSPPVAPTSTVQPDATTTAPTEPFPATPPAGILRFRQGVAQLVSDASSGSYLQSVFAPALRKKMGADPIDLSFPLAQAELAPDIAVSSFATQCVLYGDLTFPAAQDVPQTDYHFDCIASGEATTIDGGLLQFAACNLHMHPVPAKTGALWSASDMTGRGTAEFAFLKWSSAPDVARPPLPPDVLAGLGFLVQLIPAASKFQISVKLLWNGKISEQSLKTLETQNVGFTWQILFGWKALGF
jgi:hypothetical protein